MTDQQKVEQLLSEQQYIVLAVTLADGTPWAVPVRLLAHAEGEFTWVSAVSAEHSKALEINPKMAITMFQKKEDSQTGITASGVGELLEESKPGYGTYRFTTRQCFMTDETFVKREVHLDQLA